MSTEAETFEDDSRKEGESTATPGTGNRGKGRKPGVPNKSTQIVRDAIANVLESNAENFSRWLGAVAEGEKEPKVKDGKPVLGEDGQPLMKWLHKPDPGFAVQLAMGMAEYHIPKLARTEMKMSGQLELVSVTINRTPPKDCGPQDPSE